jgi:hypothetical protein
MRPIKNDKMVSIVLPVFEEPEVVAKFLDYNIEIVHQCPLFVLDAKGGEILKNMLPFIEKRFVQQLDGHWGVLDDF